MSLEGKSPEEISALAALADDVLSKPDTAGVFQRLIKKNNPGVSMPLVELEDKAHAAFSQQNAKIAALEAERAQERAQAGANALYESLKDSGAVANRNGFNDLVKYASENGFMTTEAGLRKAAQLRAQEQEAAEPTPVTVGNGLFRTGTTDDESRNFFKNPMGHARTVAMQAMDDLRKMRSAGNKAH